MRKILIQLDSDPHASAFDRVVAIDAGADEVFSYGNVQPGDVQNIIHGAIFTRGPNDLKNTAVFIGGSDVRAGEQLLAEARKHLLPQFGLQVSLLMDANGSNTTAAAAVFLASKHLSLTDAPAVVLGATGPVGQRVVRLLAREGADIRVASRKKDRAARVCELVAGNVDDAKLEPVSTGSPEELRDVVAGRALVIAAGAAGAVLLPEEIRRKSTVLQVAIDLNAVPPLGIEGVDVTAKATDLEGVVCYGAVGVGGTKMKIHKRAIARLFDSNDQVLDAEEVYNLATEL